MNRVTKDLALPLQPRRLFGIPLLYPMEGWWIDSTASPAAMMMAIATGFSTAFLLNRTAGFCKMKDIRVMDAVMDSVEALAIGIVCSTITRVFNKTPNGVRFQFESGVIRVNPVRARPL